MASQLREVLEHFAAHTAPVSLREMAQAMHLEPGVLQGMIAYWVRRGRLREVGGGSESCNRCGAKGACPFVISLPRTYELVRDDESPPPCGCGGECSP